MKNIYALIFGLLCIVQTYAQVNVEKSSSPYADLSALEQIRLQTQATPQQLEADQPNLVALQQATLRLTEAHELKMQADRAKMQLMGLPLRTKSEFGQISEFVGFSPSGKPLYFASQNLQAAATIGITPIWPGGTAGLNLAGSGLVIGEWDAGMVRTTHQEFPGNVVTMVDGASTLDDHATHVAGTLIGRGTSPSAKGGAYQATLAAYDWNNDMVEMQLAATNGLLVSNHSYALLTGFNWGNWSGTTGWHFWGNPTDLEDRDFGRYSDQARNWDLIANAYPNYLIVKAAGNDRGNGPSAGQTYRQLNSTFTGWVATTQNRAVNGGAAGYDCMGHASVSKNVLTVGAVNGITGGYSNPAQVIMSSFSSWGPTDDGRIKPDVVGKGVAVNSAYSGSNNAYATIDGTSMAGPNVASAMLLLQQHFRNLNNNQPMRSSTLKALTIHTADEAGSFPGPDYRFGWGLVNAKKATDVISNENNKHEIIDTVLSNGGVFNLPIFSNGSEPIRVTIAWNDPAAPVAPSVLNGTTPALVNDLDVRLIRTSNNTNTLPWALNPANRAAAATRADNFRDNVEQILLDAPAAGNYIVRVTHKGTLSTPQRFSLIISGKGSTTAAVTFRVDLGPQTVSNNGVQLLGSFQGFNPATTSMSRVGNSNIYSFTANLTIGDTVAYRFVNGNTLAQAETVPAGCQFQGGPNRFLIVPNQSTTLPAYLFGGCDPAPQVSPLFVAAPANNGSTTNIRAPNGSSGHRFLRGALLVPASDFQQAGIELGRTIQALGMTYATPAGVAVSGHLKLYYVSTTQTSYSRGTVWSSIIAGMNLIYDSSLTLPASGIGWSVNLPTPFNYDGNAAYLAYEWSSTGPYASTAIVYSANSALTNSCVTASDPVVAPTTLGITSFRPEIRWGLQRLAVDLEVLAVYARGKNPSFQGNGEQFTALVRNNGAYAHEQAAVSLQMSGVVTSSSTKQVAIGIDSVATVVFNPFHTHLTGVQNLVVSVPADANNANNQKSWSQQLTDSVISYSNALNSTLGVGFNTSSGLLLTRHQLHGKNRVQAVRAYISNSTTNIGNVVSAVVLDSNGVLLATSNGLNITSGHLGSWQTFTFTNPVQLPRSTFFAGLRQPSNSVGYFPLGYEAESPTRPGAFFTAPLAGGTVSPQAGFRFMLDVVLMKPGAGISPAGATSVCAGQSVTFRANSNAGLTYQWLLNNQPIAGATAVTYATSVAGNYRVIVSSGGSSDTSGVGQLVTAPAINAQITANGPLNVCQGTAVQLQANNQSGFTYQWLLNGNLISGAQSQLFSPQQSGQYRVVISNATGCIDTSAVSTVTIAPSPVAQIATPIQTEACIGSQITLRAGSFAGTTYQWLRNGVALAGQTDSLLISSTTGLYRVLLTNTSGCKDTSLAVQLTFHTPPLAQITPAGATSFCQGGNVMLQANAGAGLSYVWLRNGIQAGTGSSLNVNQSGSYLVVVTGPGNCTDTSQAVQVTVTAIPVAGITFTGISTLCTGDSAVLNATAPGPNWTFQWSKDGANIAGATAASYVARSGGAYRVAVSENGCNDISGPLVLAETTSPASPVLNLGNTADTIFSNRSGNHQWFRDGALLAGQTSNFLLITQNGTYQSRTRNGNCFSDTSAALLVQNVSATGHDLNQLRLYPNPSTGTFFIQGLAASEGAALVEIYNGQGALVYTQPLSIEELQSTVNIRPHGLATGIYHVRIQQARRSFQQRLLMQ
jgi:hypothetical protein